MFKEDELIKAHKNRASVIRNLVIFAFAILFARLWYLQIYKGDLLHRYSLKNRLRREIIRAPRGMIFGRNNQLLINNVPRFDAIVTPQYLKNKKQSIRKLSKVLDIPEQKIYRILKKNSRQASYLPVVIKKNISRRELAVIETENTKMPGVGVDIFIGREYKDKEIGVHLLGYISEISQTQLSKLKKRKNGKNYRLGDFIGQFGLEEQFDSELRGENGYEYMEVDAYGRKKRHTSSDDLFKEISNKVARPGHNIRLTIDRDLQLSAYDALKGKVGGAVAVEIGTGEVLAMVSRPSFDPSEFSRGLSSKYWASLVNDSRNPMRDRTIQEHYPPGSTFKVFSAIAALEEGVIDEDTEVNCKGSFRLGRRVFGCWKKKGHGKVDIYKAIRESCDVFFYKIGVKLDIDLIAKYANFFGLGSKTGITLPRERAGLIPTKEWKRKVRKRPWVKGETLSCAIGQSYVLSTLIQLASAYAAIAKNGELYRPHLIKEVFSNSGEIIKKSKKEMVAKIPIKQKTMEMIKRSLYQVVNHRKGTAWWHRGRGIKMAGKTGTSQVVSLSHLKVSSKCEENEYKLRDHGIFVSYAPADNPKIAVAVVIEHGCHGFAAAAIAKALSTTYMKKYHPKLVKRIVKEERILDRIRKEKENI